MTAPYAAGSDTSREAAESIDPSAIAARVLAAIDATGQLGMTCDEVETRLGLRHQTASARVRELALRGSVVDSSRRRKTRSGRNATVWVSAVPPGCQARLF